MLKISYIFDSFCKIENLVQVDACKKIYLKFTWKCDSSKL